MSVLPRSTGTGAVPRHHPPHGAAESTGGFYLGFVLASVLADVLGHIGLGEARQVYQAGSWPPNEGAFRLGLAIALISAFLFLMAAWGLYVLLRPVNKDLALLFLLLNAVGVAIQCASMFPLISALLQGDGAKSNASRGAASGGAGVRLNLYKTGFVTAQLFFGTRLSRSAIWSTSPGSSPVLGRPSDA